MRLTDLTNYLRQLNGWLVLVTLLVFSGLIKLGLWQNARAIEKEQRLSRIEQYSEQPQLSLQQILLLQDAGEDINDLPVNMTANFSTFSEQTILLDNQTEKGQLGYRVYQVAQSAEHALLINLGWVAGSKRRELLPALENINFKTSFIGHVRMIEKGIVLAEQHYQKQQWPLRVQQIELDKISQIIGQKLLPFVVYLDKNEALGYVKNWQPIVMPPEKHRGYAFQWFSLAIAWLLLMVSASIWYYRNDNNNKKG